MQKVFKIIIFGLIMLAGSGIFCRQAFAFDLIVDGKSQLVLDQSTLSNGTFSQEIIFRTVDTVNNEYEVRQFIDAPLTSGSHTIGGDNFKVRGIRGSNVYGKLFIPTGGPNWGIDVKNNEPIYHSNAAGTADLFTLVYGITTSPPLSPGYYTGHITLVLIPINSPESQEIQRIDVIVDIPNDGGSLSVSVAPAEGASSLILNPLAANDPRGAANAVVTINSSFNGPFRIMQVLPGPIQSGDGKFIDNSNLLFSIPDAQKGVAINQPTPVSNNIQTIYSSRPDGGADKAFTIAYSLADPLSLAAGNYRSRIQYLLESAGKQVSLGALDLEIRQERIFEISISPQDQRYSIDFVNLKPSDGPRLNEVLIEVKSNLGRPYQVTQNVLSGLVSGEGEKIPSQYFSLQALSVNDTTKGNLKIASKIPVEKGNVLLFVSDANGSADKFKVVYELTCPADLRAGNYSSRITYTLTEI
ncbi:MAG: hypothetical protein NTX01_08560 [Candidatus Omnitrophica bacterium]|nr:hypothetical protein [Candidatus Omnitrophota bacterium]